MNYFPPEGTRYKWSTVRQSKTNPYRSTHISGITFPQDVFLSCWEVRKDGRLGYSGLANLRTLHGAVSRKKTRVYITEEAALKALEKIAKDFLKRDTPSWAAKVLKAGWRPCWGRAE